jgi:hypothetical protein
MKREIKIAGIDILPLIREADLEGDAFLTPQNLRDLRAGKGRLPYANLLNHIILHGVDCPDAVREELAATFEPIWHHLHRLPLTSQAALESNGFYIRLFQASAEDRIEFMGALDRAHDLSEEFGYGKPDLRDRKRFLNQMEANALLSDTTLGRVFLRALAAGPGMGRGGQLD